MRVRGYQVSDLYVVALSTGGVPAAEPKRLTFDERDILGLDWTPDGQSLVFSSNRGGNQRLWKVATTVDRLNSCWRREKMPTLFRFPGGNACSSTRVR